VSSMRSTLIFILVMSLSAASQVFAQEPDKRLKNEQGAAELTDEDKEIIRNLEEIENLDWLVDTEIDLLENLDLFLTNS
jgi:hypothetical protein